MEAKKRDREDETWRVEGDNFSKSYRVKHTDGLVNRVKLGSGGLSVSNKDIKAILEILEEGEFRLNPEQQEG